MEQCNNKNYYDQKMQLEYSKSQQEPSSSGVTKEILNIQEQKEVTEDTSVVTCIQNKSKKKNKQKKTEIIDDPYAIVESQLEDKKKTWNDKNSSFDNNILITNLYTIMDQESTSKEKDLKPFWTQQSEEISKKLWLPTKIDCVDSVLNSSKESLKNTVMGKSWFSIKEKHPQKQNSLMTSFQSLQFSLPESMDSEVMKSKGKYTNKYKKQKQESNLKTLKMRIFPTQDEKDQLHLMFDQFRWYYNSMVTIVYNHYGYEKITDEKKYSNYTIRDLMRKYDYQEEIYENLIFKEFVYDENRNEIPIPEWWKGQVHSRIPRGAVSKFCSSLNSAISNYKNGNISEFTMRFMSKKKNTEYVNFEDEHYPSFINQIKSHYWYRTQDRKRKKISLSDINTKKRVLEIIYEKETGRYFLHYPVERDWYPSDDIRNDSQIKYVVRGERLISLDPGIRKFMVGYDPEGLSIFIAEKASIELTNLLLEIDCKNSHGYTKNYKEWKRIKNLVSELHWKTISYLIENYDIILLPDFRISEMIKSKKLSRMVKRLMCMFSFFSFKEKLKYKCDMHNKKLIIVDESYTSCTCTRCGFINETKGKESLVCSSCNLSIDRDAAGARNIFIKNVTLR